MIPVLSIVVPVLNEAATIGETLAALQPLRRRGVEVIVVDGGSSDDTMALALPLADAVLSAMRGRARQMNAGASMANGQALLFLHADTRLPRDADEIVSHALKRRHWGRFDVVIEGHSAMLKLVAYMMNLRSRYTGIATGDQAIFARRDAFSAVGGFAEQPLMEDIELSKRLKRLGPPATLRERVITSGRRWETRGIWRTIFLMWRLRLLYFLGISPERLIRRYQ
jgi:rSAM/selenodomain-associated transferase 2